MAPDHYIIGRWESLSFEDLAEVLSVVVRIFQREGRTGGGGSHCVKVGLLTRLSCRFRYL